MLYIIATPIGNLKDITLRALETLRAVNFIICEDTRVSQKLLSHYQINKPLISFHQHSKLQKIDYIVSRLERGEDAALITDAGTPGIADPGGALVNAVVEKNIKVSPIPGPSTLASALSIAPWRTDPFIFVGFLPKKGLENYLLKIKNQSGKKNIIKTLIFFESKYRLEKTLTFLAKIFGENSEILILREISKIHEEILQLSIKNFLKNDSTKNLKGEIVVLLKIPIHKNQI